MIPEDTVLLFDLDGVITVEESFTVLDRTLGLGGRLSQATMSDCRSDLTPDAFADAFYRRLDLLRPFSVSNMADIVASVPVYGQLRSLIAANAARCIILSSNLDCLCASLAAETGAGAVWLSHLDVIADRLTDAFPSMTDKAAVVRGYADQGLRTVMIGDGANDAEAMRAADVAVAALYAPALSPSAIEAADFAARTPDELIAILTQLSSRSVVIKA